MKRTYNITNDIRRINEDIAKVEALKEITGKAAWKEIVAIFNGVISQYFQDVWDKCGKYERNEMEIKCKKMVADSLGQILAAIDNRVKSESFLRGQLTEKQARQHEMSRPQI